MPMMSPTRSARALPLLLAFLCACAHGQSAAPLTVPYSEVNTLGGAAVGAPLAFSLSLTAAGTYTVKLSDYGAELATPAPATSLKLAISGASALLPLTVAGADTAGTQTALVGAGTATFTVQSAGTYVIHVTGSPGPEAGSGLVGVNVSDSQGDPVNFFSGILAPPPGSIPSYPGTMVGNFPIQNINNYTVALTDLAFPESLASANLTLTDSATPGSAVTLTAAGKVSQTLVGGTATAVAAGQAATGVNAGLYSVSVYPAAGGAALYTQVIQVGGVTLLASPTLAAGSYTLTAADLKYPAALGQSGAVVVYNGQAVATVLGTGTQTFTAVAGQYAVYGVALPTTSSSTWPGTGSYAVSLSSSAGPVLDVARVVATADSGAVAYSYDTTASASQSYNLDLADFAYPVGFTQIAAAAAQGIGPAGAPALLGTPAAGAGTQSVTPAAGAVSLLVLAKPGSGGTGLFGLRWTISGATPTFETTQATGSLFASRTLSITSSGNYQLTLADLGFPDSFASLDALVTTGSTVASITSAGKLSFTATPGNYDISIIGQPGNSTDSAGTYALSVASAPAQSSSSSDEGTSSGGGAIGGGLLVLLLGVAGLKIARARRG